MAGLLVGRKVVCSAGLSAECWGEMKVDVTVETKVEPMAWRMAETMVVEMVGWSVALWVYLKVAT